MTLYEMPTTDETADAVMERIKNMTRDELLALSAATTRRGEAEIGFGEAMDAVAELMEHHPDCTDIVALSEKTRGTSEHLTIDRANAAARQIAAAEDEMIALGVMTEGDRSVIVHPNGEISLTPNFA